MTENSKEYTPEDLRRMIFEIARSSLTGEPISEEVEELRKVLYSKDVQVMNLGKPSDERHNTNP